MYKDVQLFIGGKWRHAASERTIEVLNLATETVTGCAGRHYGLAYPERPFGGFKDSGYGSEGGSEAVECYLATKFVSQASPTA